MQRMKSMSEWVIYHNAKCSKSRETLQILKDQGITPQVISYLEEAPTPALLREVLGKLKLKAKEIIRTKEDDFKKLKVDLNDDDAVLRVLSANPILIERPIVIRGNKAVIGRPPQNVYDLMEK
jgi:arsenate reductase (glutaredoxin)